MATKVLPELKSMPSQQTRQGTLSVSVRLTQSEIASLRQKKKSLSVYVQKELQGRLGDRIRELKEKAA